MDGDLHDLAAAYSLDALDDDERRAFEAHLAQCAECRSALARFSETAALLADASATAPRGRVRDAVLGEIARTPQEPPVDELAARRRRRSGAFLAAAAALVAIIGAVVFVAVDRGGSELDDVLAAPDAISTVLELTPDGRRATGDFEQGTFEVVWSPGQERVAVIGADLPEPGRERVYELWAIVGGEPMPAGLFEAGGGRIREVAAFDDDTVIDAWGVTIEPATGSAAPTTPILFFAET